jgi:nucleotide-binding universal stress UspA family protein
MRILIGVDGSVATAVACDFVADRTWPNGTRVTLLAALEPGADWTGLAPPNADAIEAERGVLETALVEQAAQLRQRGFAVEADIEVGHAAMVLMSRAARSHADLIVVGSRKLGPAASAVFGSVSTHLVDHAPCPVLVVRSPSASRMLLATDGSGSSRSIPAVLGAWGNVFRGLPVEVVSIAPRSGFVTPWAAANEESHDQLRERAAIADEVASQMIALGWQATTAVRIGDPYRQIVDAGVEWGADLIVTGSRGLGTLKRLFAGSVAHEVVLHTLSSVLVVRGAVPARAPRAVAIASLSAV